MLTRVAEEKLAYSPELEEMRIQVFQDALEFYEKFLAMNPGDLQIRGETGFIHTRLGQTLAIHGYLKKSADSLSRAELLLRPVVEREPLQPKFGLALQDALHSLGFYYRGTDKSEDAIWVHAEALAIAERLVQSYPHEPIHYQRLARAQTVMGWTLDSAPGKREAARSGAKNVWSRI